jgi:hypothetical protein
MKNQLLMALLVGVGIAAGLVGFGCWLINYLYPAPRYQEPLAKQKQSCLFCSGPELREHRWIGDGVIDEMPIDDGDTPALMSQQLPGIRVASREIAHVY